MSTPNQRRRTSNVVESSGNPGSLTISAASTILKTPRGVFFRVVFACLCPSLSPLLPATARQLVIRRPHPSPGSATQAPREVGWRLLTTKLPGQRLCEGGFESAQGSREYWQLQESAAVQHSLIPLQNFATFLFPCFCIAREYVAKFCKYC